tara:strand:- start:1862 stop:2242 length:381 start_codon:yes stop_codon:yes gene_type:complete
MVDEVYRSSEKMIVLHQRINALVQRDWRALRRFDDIPWDYFRQLWNQPSPEDHELDTQAARPSATKSSPTKTRQSTAARKPRATKANPTPSETLSSAEVKAKQFQNAMAAKIAEAADARPPTSASS